MEWGGKIFVEGAHPIGLIAGGQFQDPLREGAARMTGSAGKTFGGPQGGIIVRDDPSLTEPITHSVFPAFAATHQVNRAAALAVATAEMIEFGQTYMAQIARNAQATPDTASIPNGAGNASPGAPGEAVGRQSLRTAAIASAT